MAARTVLLALAATLVIASCADSADTSVPGTGPATTEPVTTSPVTTSPVTTSPATTLPPPLTTTTLAPTTTTLPATTTAPPTTTTTLPAAPVHSGPTIPAALSRSAVPWGDVGPGWHLVLYDSSRFDGAVVEEGPTLLYVADPDGTLYEIAAWDGFPKPWTILDWRPDGTEALVRLGGGPAGPDRIERIELTTGTADTLHEITPAEAGTFSRLAGYTRPTGANHVVFRNDGTTERVERRNPDGVLLAMLWEQPAVAGPDAPTWLYGFDGTTAVIGHEAGMALVANDGTPIRDLWVPMGRICTPVRWWTATRLLASCRGLGPAFPHDYYHQLWLLEIDGTAGTPLDSIPAAEIPVVDFGHVDAWATTAGVRLQWRGDCGAAAVRSLAADGSAVAMAASFVAQGYEMVEVADGRLTILGWADCGGDGGELLSTDVDLGDTVVLIPRLAGVPGVVDAAGLAEVYP